MSQRYTKEIQCRYCDKCLTETIWHTINTETNPEMKEPLLSGKLFINNCPYCSKPVMDIYSLLYHNPVSKTAIYLVVTQSDTQQAIHSLDALQPPVTKRVVNSVASLREKDLIFSKNLDDRVIECLKVFASRQIQKNNPNVDLKPIFLTECETAYKFETFDGSISTLISINSAENLIKLITKHLQAKNSDYFIDTDWALSFLSDNANALSDVSIQEKHKNQLQSHNNIKTSVNSQKKESFEFFKRKEKVLSNNTQAAKYLSAISTQEYNRLLDKNIFVDYSTNDFDATATRFNCNIICMQSFDEIKTRFCKTISMISLLPSYIYIQKDFPEDITINDLELHFNDESIDKPFGKYTTYISEITKQKHIIKHFDERIFKISPSFKKDIFHGKQIPFCKACLKLLSKDQKHALLSHNWYITYMDCLETLGLTGNKDIYFLTRSLILITLQNSSIEDYIPDLTREVSIQKNTEIKFKHYSKEQPFGDYTLYQKDNLIHCFMHDGSDYIPVASYLLGYKTINEAKPHFCQKCFNSFSHSDLEHMLNPEWYYQYKIIKLALKLYNITPQELQNGSKLSLNINNNSYLV